MQSLKNTQEFPPQHINTRILHWVLIVYMRGKIHQKVLPLAIKMYGDTLKADFVQVAHHGAGTGSTSSGGVMDVYTKSASPVVLWPVGVGEAGYAKQIKIKRNIYLTELETTKEIFVAGYRIVRLPLPYTIGTSGCESILK